MKVLYPQLQPVLSGFALGWMLICSGASVSAGQRSGLLCPFEDVGESTGVFNLGEEGGSIQLINGSEKVQGVARFGEGALRISNSDGTTRGGMMASFASGEFDFLAKELKAFTISVWIKVPEIRGVQLVWRIPVNSGGSGGFMLSYNRDDVLYFSAQDADGQARRAASSKVGLEVDQWIHLAFTFEQGNVTFYVNGEQKGPVKSTGLKSVPESNPAASYLSLFHSAAEGTLVDDLAFFAGEVLLPANIESLYSEGLERYLEAQ